ncbi:MAG: ATP-binding protein [Flavobacteriaceae bacterium]|nr:ATP-binding protein [Flavobacteriaceae bacterium]MCY4217218.1 ATP-binding protein [Flavobacteriaceae bacterium]MCY4267171.1 ATP-binding protein [Flavobacteriaceae bacterium]MCY4298556.1 ATP-binding protein [Flavobacteriaceae bacterium]
MKDRGKAEYFHGREKELSAFKELVEKAEKEKSGTIFLVQGAPGVGKSAFLEHCKGMINPKKWDVAEGDPDIFWNVKQMRRALRLGGQIRIFKAFAQLGIEKLIKFGAEFRWADKTIIGSVNARKKKGLLLVVDEVQDLGRKAAPPDKVSETMVRNVLNTMHNWKINKPFILLVGGLGMSKSVFKEYGISRFNDNCAFNLEKLDEKSERNILWDWIVKKEGVNKNNRKIGHWINEITNHTLGWPQHVTSYANVLSRYLKEHKGDLSEKGLKHVLTLGKAKRTNYYHGRIEELEGEERELIAQLLKEQKSRFSKNDIVFFFQNKLDSNESKNLFDRALGKGVFHQNQDGFFNVPVPSMKNWLLSEYGSVGNGNLHGGSR